MPHSGVSPIVSVRIFIYFSLIKFVNTLSQKFLWLSSSNFHNILAMIRNRYNKLFSLITQPWRHLAAILWIHVIIHIFMTIHDKLIKFNTHKLQVISQHTDNPCPRVRHDAHVRARQHFKMLKITYKQFWVRTRSFRAFQNFPSVRVRARVVRAHSAHEWQKIQNFHMIWMPDTTIDNFHSFAVTLDLS